MKFEARSWTFTFVIDHDTFIPNGVWAKAYICSPLKEVNYGDDFIIWKDVNSIRFNSSILVHSWLIIIEITCNNGNTQ